MTEATTLDERPDTAERADRPAWWRRPLPWAFAVYAVLALYVTHHGFRHGRLLGLRPSDVSFNEWMLANAAHAIAHLDNPFFTTLQNAPAGVNLMTNIGDQLPGLILAPVTWLFGPAVSFLLWITANLALTAAAWYWVLSRHVVKAPAAAFVGGLVLGFAPAMIAHSSGHPHITAQWLVPFILLAIKRLADPGPRWRFGLVLGLLITAQVLISEEVLLMVAVGAVIGIVAYVISRPRAARAVARPFLTSLGIAAGVALVLCAYPFWMQFAGPQHRFGAPGTVEAHSLKGSSFVSYATQSIGGGRTSGRGLAPNVTEEASFFGWPVVILSLALAVWLWRNVLARCVAVAGFVAALLSLGPRMGWGSARGKVPGPFVLLDHLPVLSDAIVARFALITTVCVGVLLAMGTDRFLAAVTGRWLRVAGAVVLAAALVPMLPKPLTYTKRPAVPEFIRSGDWQKYVRPGRTLVPVPVNDIRAIRWAAAADVGFAVPQGYFLGPTSPTDPTGRWSSPRQPTATLMAYPRAVTPADVAQAHADAAYWKADAFVLAKPALPAELTVMTALFGAPVEVDDVYVWTTR